MSLYHSVILTCPESSVKELADTIQEKYPDLDITQMPLIKTEKSNVSETDLIQIQDAEWILFTSKNAVRFFIATLENHQLKLNKNTKLACIGDKTASFVQKKGLTTHFIADGKTGEDFAREFIDKVKTTNIVIPRGNLANPHVPDILRQKFTVTDIEVYQTNYTIPGPEHQKKIRQKKYDFVVFTSPSAVDAFMHHFSEPPLQSVSIGPVTTKKLQEYGIIPDLEPEQPGYDEIANELAYFYNIKKQ